MLSTGLHFASESTGDDSVCHQEQIPGSGFGSTQSEACEIVNRDAFLKELFLRPCHSYFISPAVAGGLLVVEAAARGLTLTMLEREYG